MTDWWAVGITYYEFLHGFRPFSGGTIDVIKNNVLNCELSFDSGVDKNAKSMIQEFLTCNPSDRLGGRGGIDSIRKHPNFKEPPFHIGIHLESTLRLVSGCWYYAFTMVCFSFSFFFFLSFLQDWSVKWSDIKEARNKGPVRDTSARMKGTGGSDMSRMDSVMMAARGGNGKGKGDVLPSSSSVAPSYVTMLLFQPTLSMPVKYMFI